MTPWAFIPAFTEKKSSRVDIPLIEFGIGVVTQIWYYREWKTSALVNENGLGREIRSKPKEKNIGKKLRKWITDFVVLLGLFNSSPHYEKVLCILNKKEKKHLSLKLENIFILSQKNSINDLVWWAGMWIHGIECH